MLKEKRARPLRGSYGSLLSLAGLRREMAASAAITAPHTVTCISDQALIGPQSFKTRLWGSRLPGPDSLNPHNKAYEEGINLNLISQMRYRVSS